MPHDGAILLTLILSMHKRFIYRLYAAQHSSWSSSDQGSEPDYWCCMYLCPNSVIDAMGTSAFGVLLRPSFLKNQSKRLCLVMGLAFSSDSSIVDGTLLYPPIACAYSLAVLGGSLLFGCTWVALLGCAVMVCCWLMLLRVVACGFVWWQVGWGWR